MALIWRVLTMLALARMTTGRYGPAGRYQMWYELLRTIGLRRAVPAFLAISALKALARRARARRTTARGPASGPPAIPSHRMA